MKAEIMDLKPYLPQLSVAERDRRWSATRERMAAKGLDCLVVWGNTISQGLGMTNVRYLTQVGSWHGGVALFPLARNTSASSFRSSIRPLPETPVATQIAIARPPTTVETAATCTWTC